MNKFGYEALFTVMYCTGAAQLYRATFGRKRGVLSYHNALPAETLTIEDVYHMDMSLEVFERQIRYLSKRWNVFRAEEIGNCVGNGFFLSFDDGMLDAYTSIAPILERYGLTGIFAICPGLVEGDIPHIWRDHIHVILQEAVGGQVLLPMDGYAQPAPVVDGAISRLTRSFRKWVVENRIADVYGAVKHLCAKNGLEYRRSDHQPQRFHPMTWEMIRDLRDRGHVIASHTWSHRILSLLPTHEKRLELERAKACMEKRLGQEVLDVVYPYGGQAQVDRESMELASECGYKRGFMNEPATCGRMDGFDIPRFALAPNASSRVHLYAELSGLKTKLRRIH